MMMRKVPESANELCQPSIHGSHRTVWRVLQSTGVLMAAFGLWVVQPGFGEEKPNTADSKKVAAAAPTDPSNHGAIGVNLYGSEDHVLISKIVPKSPAERAGLQVGDEIRYFHGERIHTVQSLMDEISASSPGTKAEVVIRRGGQRQVLQIELTSFASLYGDKPAASDPALRRNTPTQPTPGTATRAMSPETARRMRVLERQIARMQQEMEALKSTPYVPQPVPTTQFNVNSWIEQHRRGENEGDPALFQ